MVELLLLGIFVLLFIMVFGLTILLWVIGIPLGALILYFCYLFLEAYIKADADRIPDPEKKKLSHKDTVIMWIAIIGILCWVYL